MLAVDVLITKSFTMNGLASKVELAGKFLFSGEVLNKQINQFVTANFNLMKLFG